MHLCLSMFECEFLCLVFATVGVNLSICQPFSPSFLPSFASHSSSLSSYPFAIPAPPETTFPMVSPVQGEAIFAMARVAIPLKSKADIKDMKSCPMYQAAPPPLPLATRAVPVIGILH